MFFKKKLIYLSKSLFFIKFQRVICFGGDLSLILKIAHIMYLIDLGVPKIGFLFFFWGVSGEGVWLRLSFVFNLSTFPAPTN